MKKKIMTAVLITAMAVSMLAGCSQGKSSVDVNGGKQVKVEEGGKKQQGASGNEKITLKMFSNLPDRKGGQGLVEQMIIDEYMKENSNVAIEVEALDDEAYKTIFKAYAMNGMPDIVSIWGQPSFLNEVLDAGVLAELKEEDYTEYKFISGSLEGFKKDGKLYGLPRNSDIMGFYYNQKLFDDNGWSVPDTYEEFLKLCKTIKAEGYAPIAMDGGDGWPLAIYLHDLLLKVAGNDTAELVNAAIAKGDFSGETFKKAAQLLQDSAAAGMFQTGYDSQDYGTAMNLFTNGQAAMFYMGSWEAAMALNEDIDPEIRNNIKAFTMPTVAGGKGSKTDIMAWNGGGYAVAADSNYKEEAVKFLNYMYQPDKLSRYGWENGVGMSAQNQSEYMSGKETKLQLQWMDLLNGATSVSGTPLNDCGPSIFKTVVESEIQSLSNGTKSVEEFLKSIGEACK